MNQIDLSTRGNPRVQALYSIEFYYEALIEIIPNSGMKELLSVNLFNSLESWALKQYMLLCLKYLDRNFNMQHLMSNTEFLREFDASLKVFLIRKHTGVSNKFERELEMICMKNENRIPPRSPLRPKSLSYLNFGYFSERSQSTFNWDMTENSPFIPTSPIIPIRRSSSRSDMKMPCLLEPVEFPSIEEEPLSHSKKRRINRSQENRPTDFPYPPGISYFDADIDDIDMKHRIRHTSSYSSLKELLGRTKNYFKIFSRRSNTNL